MLLKFIQIWIKQFFFRDREVLQFSSTEFTSASFTVYCIRNYLKLPVRIYLSVYK